MRLKETNNEEIKIKKLEIATEAIDTKAKSKRKRRQEGEEEKRASVTCRAAVV